MQSIPSRDLRLVGQVPAEWWTFVRLAGTQSYAVPSDRYFVVTWTDNPNYVLADGQPVESLEAVSATWGVEMNGTHVVFPPGTLLTWGYIGVAKLWGYLEPIR